MNDEEQEREKKRKKHTIAEMATVRKGRIILRQTQKKKRQLGFDFVNGYNAYHTSKTMCSWMEIVTLLTDTWRRPGERILTLKSTTSVN